MKTGNMRALMLVSLAAASLLGLRNAEAQVATDQTNSTMTASASISAVVVFDVNDDVLECGTVTAGASACGSDKGTAQLTVKSNVPWALTSTDDAESTANVVTLMNDDIYYNTGTFQVGTVFSSMLGNETNADVVTISTGSIPTGASDPFALTMEDGSGTFTGTFTVSIAAQ